MNQQVSEASASKTALSIKANLRVLLVIDADPVRYPPTLNAARALAHAGAQVVCLGGARSSADLVEMPAGARITYAQFGRSGQGGLEKVRWAIGRWQFRQAFSREMAAFKPHLVIAYDQGAAWAALGALHDKTHKVVLHVHDNANRNDQSWYSLRAMQWRAVMRATHRFNARVVPEQERAKDLRDSWQARGDFVVVANAPLFRQEHRRNTLLRQKLGISSGDPIAISIGNIGLLSAFTAALPLARQNWHFVSVGEADHLAITVAQARALELGVSHRVHVLPYTSYDIVCDWLRGCDVGPVFYPSTNTSINWRSAGTASVKLMEYLAAGLPVLTTHQESLLRLNAETCALQILTEETPQAIASALDGLEPANPAWQGLSSAARAAHTTRFNMEAQLAPLMKQLDLSE